MFPFCRIQDIPLNILPVYYCQTVFAPLMGVIAHHPKNRLSRAISANTSLS
jgi:hypothetical protein